MREPQGSKVLRLIHRDSKQDANPDHAFTARQAEYRRQDLQIRFGSTNGRKQLRITPRQYAMPETNPMHRNAKPLTEMPARSAAVAEMNDPRARPDREQASIPDDLNQLRGIVKGADVEGYRDRSDRY